MSFMSEIAKDSGHVLAGLQRLYGFYCALRRCGAEAGSHQGAEFVFQLRGGNWILGIAARVIAGASERGAVRQRERDARWPGGGILLGEVLGDDHSRALEQGCDGWIVEAL